MAAWILVVHRAARRVGVVCHRSVALLPAGPHKLADSAPKPAEAAKKGTPPERIVQIETTG